jgi:cobalt/nickel transport system permease protein
MMIGHLTIAGFAELALTGGVVAFLQRTDARLLAAAAGRDIPAVSGRAIAQGPGSLQPLWITLALLLVLTPLGLLAGGAAWGEWAASDFSDPAARQAMASASRGQAPPAAAPAGLRRLASVWTAPLPDYAPPLLRSAEVGYLLSGMFGAGLVVLAVTAAGAIMRVFRRSRADRDGVIP